MSPSKSPVFRMSPSSPLYKGPRQPSLSISQPEVSELELSFSLSLTISNLFQTNALVAYKSSDDAETPVPHALKDTAEGSDDFEPDTSVALPLIPSMLSPVSLNFSLFQLSNSSFSLHPLLLNLIFHPLHVLVLSRSHPSTILLIQPNILCQKRLWNPRFSFHQLRRSLLLLSQHLRRSRRPMVQSLNPPKMLQLLHLGPQPVKFFMVLGVFKSLKRQVLPLLKRCDVAREFLNLLKFKLEFLENAKPPKETESIILRLKLTS